MLRLARPDEPITLPEPVLPEGVTIRHATPEDAEPLKPIMREADPDNPTGTWRDLPGIISRAATPTKRGVGLVFVAEDDADGIIGGIVSMPPAHWVLKEPRLQGNEHLMNHLIGSIDALAVHPDARQKGIARALITTTERMLAHGIGSSMVYVTHEPNLTDFYARCGCTLAPEGLAVETPSGIITHRGDPRYLISWRTLRTAVATRKALGLTASGQAVDIITGVVSLPR